MPHDDEDTIRKRAYEIWDREGRPDGMHIHHWDRASRELEEERSALLQSDPDPLRDSEAHRDGEAPGEQPGDLQARVPPVAPSLANAASNLVSTGDLDRDAQPNPLAGADADDLVAPPAVGLTSMGVPSAGPSPMADVPRPTAKGRGKPKRSG